MGSWALGAAIGFFSGVLSGAFGIGGGIVTTPAIRLIMGAPALIAVGTPLPVIIPSAITGGLSYHRRGLVDLRAGAVIGIAGSLTAVAGALVASRVGGEIVLLGTALLIFYAAADTILQVVRPTGVSAVPPGELHEAEEAGVAGPSAVLDDPDARPTGSAGAAPTDAEASATSADVDVERPRLAVLLAMGLLTGLYSGFFGLGGGFVLVPMLTRWLRFPIKRAIGTSLVAVCLLAVPGTITHALLGNVDWIIAAGLMVGVVPGAFLGARLTMGARDREVRVAFALMLVAAGAWLAVSEIAKMAR